MKQGNNTNNNQPPFRSPVSDQIESKADDEELSEEDEKFLSSYWPLCNIPLNSKTTGYELTQKMVEQMMMNKDVLNRDFFHITCPEGIVHKDRSTVGNGRKEQDIRTYAVEELQRIEANRTFMCTCIASIYRQWPEEIIDRMQIFMAEHFSPEIHVRDIVRPMDKQHEQTSQSPNKNLKIFIWWVYHEHTELSSRIKEEVLREWLELNEKTTQRKYELRYCPACRGRGRGPGFGREFPNWQALLGTQSLYSSHVSLSGYQAKRRIDKHDTDENYRARLHTHIPLENVCQPTPSDEKKTC